MNQPIAAVAVAWLACAPALGVEITTIETDVGTYEVLRLPQHSHGFELTDDRRIGVQVSADTRGRRSFRMFSTDDVDSFSFERNIDDARDWVVVGDRLVVARGEQLETFSLPKLDSTGAIRLSDAAPVPDTANVVPEVHLVLAASVNQSQNILFVTDPGNLKGCKPPFDIRVGNERMTVTKVDDFRGRLFIARSQGVAHPVSAEVVTVGENDAAALAPIQRVAGGWYCDGYVFDSTGTRIECALYYRHASPKTERREQIVAETLRPERRRPAQPRSNPLTISAALETVPADIEVSVSRGAVTVRICGYDGGFVANGIHDLFILDKEETVRDPAHPSHTPTPSELRVDGRDVTFVVGNMGYHLRIQQFDTFESDIPAPQRFAVKQPAMLLDDLAPSPKYEFTDGPDTHPVITRSCVHGQGDARRKLEEETRDFLLEYFNGRGTSVAEFEKRLAAYRSQVSGEFERTVGRAPQGVPVPYRVEAETRWEVSGIQRDKLHYCLWKEWPEQELVELLFEDVLEASRRQELERRRDEIRQEQERARQRTIAEAEQRRLAVKRERKERQHAALAQSLTTRTRIASVLCLAGIACFVVVRFRSRQGAPA